jgi:hypothetical protein
VPRQSATILGLRLRGLPLSAPRRVAALALALALATGPALAQTAPPPSAPLGEAPTASALMSATKATTYKIGTALTNALILTAGTGVVGGTLLTAFVTGESWLFYGVNDYLWDTYAPKPAPRPDGSFDAKESAWRSTEKWLTYKPVVAAFKFGAIYAWTGSVPAMLTLGTITIVANTGVFYANNIGWDLYEWWRTPLIAPAAPSVAPGAVQTAAPTGVPAIRE